MNVFQSKLCPLNCGQQDEGERWPSIDDIISSPFSPGEKGEDTATTVDTSADNHSPFWVHFSKAMLHLAKAAVRASWGRFWLKVKTCVDDTQVAFARPHASDHRIPVHNLLGSPRVCTLMRGFALTDGKMKRVKELES